MATKVKTLVAPIQWVTITGEGKNNAMQGNEPHFQYTASILFDKDSKEHKQLTAQIDSEWKTYKEKFGVKGLPKTNGIKPYMVESDDKSDIDPATEKVRKVDSGKVMATFKTNTKWPDGNDQIVRYLMVKAMISQLQYVMLIGLLVMVQLVSFMVQLLLIMLAGLIKLLYICQQFKLDILTSIQDLR